MQVVALCVCLLLGGFLLNLAKLHPSFAALAELSFARHAFEVMLVTELSNTLVDVDVPGAPANLRIKAEVILETLGLTAERIPTDLLALLALNLGLLLATTAAVGAHLWRLPRAPSRPWRVVRRRLSSFNKVESI